MNHLTFIYYFAAILYVYTIENEGFRAVQTLSPFSCFRRFRLLHIFTAQIDRIIATIKNKIPPTTPAVMALCLTLAGTGNLISSLDSKLVCECAFTRK